LSIILLFFSVFFFFLFLTYLPCFYILFASFFFFLIIAQSYFFYRLLDILYQQRHIHGSLRRPSSHNTVLAFWRLLPKYSVSILNRHEQ